jgi:hypothetical protein
VKLSILLGVITVLLIISACGGGSGGNDNSTGTTGTSGSSGSSGTNGSSGSTTSSTGTGSTTGSSTSSGSTTGGTTGSSVPPNTVDLTFEDYHMHGGVYSDAVTFHFRIANHNTANVTVTNIPWVLNDQNGNTLFSGTIASLPANTGQDILEDYVVQPGLQSFFIIIDPGNTIPETSKTNNSAEVVSNAPTNYPVIAPQANELTWYDPHIHHPVNNGLAFHITVENIGTSNTTLTNVPWQITREDGVIVKSGVIASLPPGEAAAQQVETISSMSESVGEHTYTWVIDPKDTIPDDDKTDDTVQTIVVIQPAGDA